MEKKITVKEIDRYVGTLNPDKTISEYLISVWLAPPDGVCGQIEAFVEIGDIYKDIRVNELIMEHFMVGDSLDDNIIKTTDVVEEISFEEYKQKI